MKTFFILLFILMNSVSLYAQAFTVDIFDYNFSMAFSVHYHITNDSISIIRLGELVGEKPVNLLRKKLDLTQRNQIMNLINSAPFSKLKTEYRNRYIEDGDQKQIIIKINKRRKIINIANVYNNIIAKLFDNVNEALAGNLKIRYQRR